MSRASKQVKYGIWLLAYDMAIAGEGMQCIHRLVASSQWPKPRRESSTKPPPVPDIWIWPTTTLAPSCSRASLSHQPRDDNEVTQNCQYQKTSLLTCQHGTYSASAETRRLLRVHRRAAGTFHCRKLIPTTGQEYFTQHYWPCFTASSSSSKHGRA